MSDPLPRNAAVEPAHQGEATDVVDLAEYLATVVESRRLIAATAALLLVGVAIYVALARPTYRSDVLLQVEEKASGLGALADLGSAMGSAAFAQTATAAEMEIIRSRSLIGAVVDQLALDVVAEPHYFPLFGAGIARRRGGGELGAPPFGLSRFAWGGERIRVDRLEVPAQWEGRPLRLVAGAAGSYRLYGPEGGLLLEGRIGEPAHAAAPDGRGAVELVVSELRARKGTELVLARIPRDEAIARLQGELQILEKGKDTGILKVALEGEDPKKVAATLDEIARAARRENVGRRNAEAEKTLEFVERQLPVVKATLEVAEKALSEFRARSGTVDVGMAAQGALTEAVEVEKQIVELKLKRAELQERFAPSHPALLVLRQQEAELQSRRAAIGAFIRSLPVTETHSLQLMRDVKVADELYLLLLNKAQELRVMKSGTQGSVYILDTAMMPRGPVKPRVRLALVEGLFAGLLLGVALAILRRRLRPGEQDPDRVEQRLGIPVYAAIPHSAKQDQLTRQMETHQPSQVLARVDPEDPAIESLRGLRTSLQFAQLEASNNLICIGGPSPSVGKSFVAVNLACVLAAAGKRILLVDGDMRKGYLHRHLGLDRSPGLVEAIRGEVTAEEALRTVSATMSFLPAGAVPPNPSELLTSERFKSVVGELSKLYEVVLIDAPPVLAVADAVIIGQLAGVSLLVLRAGRHPMGEISLTVKRLEQGGVRPKGFVFNDVSRQSAYGGYGYHYYSYRRTGSDGP